MRKKTILNRFIAIVLILFVSMVSVAGTDVLAEEQGGGDINVNITVPDFITKMIYYYNMQGSKDLVVPELRKLGELLMKNDKTLSKYNFLSSNVKPIIREKYINSNRKLCEKYLDEKYLLWLNSEVNEEEKTTLYSYNGADIVELCKAVNKILTDLPSEN